MSCAQKFHTRCTFGKVAATFWVLWLAVSSVVAQAVDFEADIGESIWESNSSIFECRLEHRIPFFGRAVFFQRAGELQRFQMESETPRLQSGQALLESITPMWKSESATRDLGYVDVVRGGRPVRLGAQLSQRLLAELHEGMQVTFTRRPWYGGEESARVIMSSVNFRPGYLDYLECLQHLLPVNFSQIERSAIYFGSSNEALLPTEVAKIDNIGTFFKADPSISAFYVDGHTDSVGARQENFELSRERAEMIMKFLVSRGIPEERIITRWHGERYPVASNQTREGRAQNRRVTIRLVRGGGEEPVNEETLKAVDEGD